MGVFIHPEKRFFLVVSGELDNNLLSTACPCCIACSVPTLPEITDLGFSLDDLVFMRCFPVAFLNDNVFCDPFWAGTHNLKYYNTAPLLRKRVNFYANILMSN